MRFLLTILLAPSLAFAAKPAPAGGGPDPQQNEYHLRQEIPLPPGEVMEIGSIALMPDRKVAVTTRRGDLWICSGAYETDLSKVTWKKFAHGLHEPFGMSYQDGTFTLTQRPEVTRIRDKDGDGIADSFRTLCSDWGSASNYHEYAFGGPAGHPSRYSP